MKPLRLGFEAFGPFKDQEEIDFTIFEENQLFLIAGPTGSGKTTIFDAMSYALFGELTGDYRKENSIKSQHASLNQICKVWFEFSNNQKIYRVERTPKQPAIGRGGKIVEKPATAFLYHGDKVISDKIGEVTKKIEEILLYDAKQFRKIVVLPQGKFIDILNAKPDEREKLLASVLQTTKYDFIADKLKLKTAELYGAIKGIENKITGILESTSQKSFAILQEETIKVEENLEEIEGKKGEINEVFQNLTKQKENAVAQAKILDLFLDTKTKYSLLETKVVEFNNKKKLVQQLDALMTAVQLEKNCLQLKEQIITAEKEREKLNEKIVDLQQQEEAIFVNLATKTKQKELLNVNQERLLVLAKLQEKQLQFKKLLKEIEDKQERKNLLNQENKELAVSLDNFQKSLAESSLLLKDVSIQLKEIQIAEIELVNVEVLAKKAKSIKGKVHQRDHLIHDLKILKNEILLNNEKLSIIQEKRLLAEREYILNQAADLAEHLRTGEPCPVCGSIHHPYPAVSGDVVDKKVIQAFLKEEQNLILTLARDTERVLACENMKDTLDIDIDSSFNLEHDYETELKTMKLKVAEKNQKEKTSEVLAGSIKSFAESIAKVEATMAANKTHLYDLENEIISLENERKASEVDLNINYAIELESLTNENNRIQKEYDTAVTSVNEFKISRDNALAKRSFVVDNLSSLLANLSIEQENFKNELKSQDVNVEEFKSIIAHVTELKVLKTEVDIFFAEYQSLQTKLETYQQQIEKFVSLDITKIETELLLVIDLKEKIESEYQSGFSLTKKYKDAIHSIEEYQKSIENENIEYTTYAKLTEIVNGTRSGSAKISLQRYVLCMVLDEILLSSNHYLHRFTDGRYLFSRSNDFLKLSQRGLEMNVLDTFTDQIRSVSTLSGGESFVASLAFALGMSEIVGARHGGIQIETLFIDEGFGALDDKMLSEALNALADIKQSGKMIGIISHVEELKNVIPAKIMVSKTNEGSHLEVNVE